ncbi:ER membrane protein complex subunit 6 [Cylas formicarius]|uniref:ER membrane protein complex subunit 6 n=1 Tax=Cylas formicarius TaxID=197179 RepID=UPI0029584F58|nr:ER membrane protein complex subunit 6 [Cylas formicarius]XP_060525613.1 ER membrane protein complex subunit 6 [Cylas formicarius]XP_060525614.1 ER membrane protein complex subunit 6 [Cylas formicarius]XP_060525615.1 ER membrane protein complex subunit 6 [Cylas formicarius]
MPNKSAKQEAVKAYSESAVRNNLSIVEYCRTSTAALSGCTAGILGLTSLHGALFYVLSITTLWILILWKAGFSSWQKYFISRKSLLVSGLFGQLFTYILCWTFIYGMVHVY